MPDVPVPVIEWRDAGDGYQEATAAVPYDYVDPGGRSLPLHMVRLPAADPAQRIGTLFLNYGGPGYPAAAPGTWTCCGGRPVATMPGSPSASAKPAVEVVGLRRRYGSFEAVQGISFTVHPGEVLALLGVNGAGKTSAPEVVEALAPADGGTVRIPGHDPVARAGPRPPAPGRGAAERGAPERPAGPG